MMLYALVLCCCAALVPTALCTKYEITHISNSQIKDVGQEVEFNCTVKNPENKNVLWVKIPREKNDRVPLSSYNMSFVERFSVKYHEASSTYTLKIQNLTETDTAFYECQIQINEKDRVGREVDLQIRRPPTINRVNSTVTAEMSEGDSFELKCFADGFPQPRISWKREGDALFFSGNATMSGETLRLSGVSKDDRGVYYCIAENDVGAGDRHNVTVRVKFAPVVTAVRPRVGQATGYDIDLECNVEAYPAPEIIWSKNGAELQKEQLQGNSSEYASTLRRYSVGTSDYGEYVCHAKNARGDHEARIDLFETIVPVLCISGSCG